MKLDDLIRETLRCPASTPIAETDGPGALEAWDSVAHIRLLAALERAYSVRLEPEEFAGAATVAELRALLRRKGLEDL